MGQVKSDYKLLTERGIEERKARLMAATVEAMLAGHGEEEVRAAPRWRILPIDGGIRLREC